MLSLSSVGSLAIRSYRDFPPDGAPSKQTLRVRLTRPNFAA